jgi:hypothetical protein
MNLLGALGIRLDNDLIAGDFFNECGYFESREFVDLNRDILRALGMTWHSVFSLALPDGWVDQPALLPPTMDLRRLVLTKVAHGSGIWGFKDPIATVLLPLYDRVFAQCRVRPGYVMCIRDPQFVAQSLKQRNDFPPLLSELLWLDYTMPAIQFLGDRLQAIVDYDRWFQDGIAQAESLARLFGLNADARSLDQIVRRVVAPALNHADAPAAGYELACSGSVYQLLLAGERQRALAVFTEAWQTIRLVIGSMPQLQASSSSQATENKAQSMRGSGTIMSQVFWRSADAVDFEERNSTRGFTADALTRRSIRLTIPAGLKKTPQFRLDLVDVPGVARLFGIRLVDVDGGTLWEWDGSAVTLASLDHRHMIVLQGISEIGVFLYFPTCDPNLLLPAFPGIEKLCETGGSLDLDFSWHGTLPAV